MSGLMWLLLIVLVIAAIIAKIKRSARVVIFRNEDLHNARANHQNDFSQHVQGLRNSNVEQMVSCEKCGIYIPASEVFFREGKVFCCEEHSN